MNLKLAIDQVQDTLTRSGSTKRLYQGMELSVMSVEQARENKKLSQLNEDLCKRLAIKKLIDRVNLRTSKFQ